MVISGLNSCVSSIVREGDGFPELFSLSHPVTHRESTPLLLVSRQNRRLSSLARLYVIIALAMTSQDPLLDEHKKPRHALLLTHVHSGSCRDLAPCKRSAALVLTLEFQEAQSLKPRGLDATAPPGSLNGLVLCLFGITFVLGERERCARRLPWVNARAHSPASNKRGLVYPDRIGRKLCDSRRILVNPRGLPPPSARSTGSRYPTIRSGSRLRRAAVAGRCLWLAFQPPPPTGRRWP